MAAPPDTKDEYTLEKGSDHEKNFDDPKQAVVSTQLGEDKYHFDAHDLDRVQRKLHQRHVQMIAIAGTIGTGLFLGSGRALAQAGPLGALIAYAIVGSVAYSSLCAVGEMTSHAPISGTFPHFAARFVDPALGFAVGWNYFYTNAITLPVEVVAATILIGFWDTNVDHQPIYIAVICILTSLINLFGVRYFGESEFVFSIIKLMLITGLIIGGLAVSLGGGPSGDRIGFRYWKDPGPINTYLLEGGRGRWCAVISVFVQAAFSFQGMELVAVAASETKHPRRNIAKAVRKVFYRILIFYLLGVLITGMLVPYNDDKLLKPENPGTASQSPYVIAFTRAGVKGLPHVINGAVFSSAFSAGNSFLYSGSRVLYGLALRGQAPKIFAKCTNKGLPVVAVVTTALFSVLAFLSVQTTANQVFVWLQNLTTVGGFFAWLTINVTYYRFYRGTVAQGIDRKKFIYYSSLQPYLSIWGITWLVFFILTTGFNVFFPGHWSSTDFLTAYLNIPIFILLYVGFKIVKKTRVWRASEIDFWTGVPSVEETEAGYEPPTTLKGKIFDAIF